MRYRLTTFAVALVLLSCAHATAQTRQLDALKSIKPLSTPHATWVAPVTWYTEQADLAFEVARITGGVSVGIEDRHAATHKHALQIMTDIPGLRLNLVYAPWLQTTPGGADFGKPRWEQNALEIVRLGRCLERIKATFGQSPDAVMLNYELGRRPEGRDTPEQGQAIDRRIAARLNLTDATIREVFPQAKVVWFGSPNEASGPGYIGPKLDFFAPSLYSPFDRLGMVKKYSRVNGIAQRDYALATKRIGICAFVGLGAGYDRNGQWQPHLKYPTYVSAWTARYLASETNLRRVTLYPGPGESEDFVEQFIAYAIAMQWAKK